MLTLSQTIKASGDFVRELDHQFPKNNFDTEHILSYVSACDTIVLREARKIYHTHSLQFINPVFIIDGKIYPPAVLPGNPDVIRLAKANIQLIEKKSVLPLSNLITASKQKGVCLCSGMQVFYHDYLGLDLNNLRTKYTLLHKDSSEAEIINIISSIELDPETLPEEFAAFCNTLGLLFAEDKKRVARTLLLYKLFFEAVYDQPVYISFINNPSGEHSFFDLLFTVVSLKPLSEEELNDFGKVVAEMAAPLDNYYKTSGPAKQNNDKRAAQIQRELLNSLRGMSENAEKKVK